MNHGAVCELAKPQGMMFQGIFPRSRMPCRVAQYKTHWLLRIKNQLADAKKSSIRGELETDYWFKFLSWPGKNSVRGIRKAVLVHFYIRGISNSLLRALQREGT